MLAVLLNGGITIGSLVGACRIVIPQQLGCRFDIDRLFFHVDYLWFD